MDTMPDNSAAAWLSLLRPARASAGGGRPALSAVIERIRRRWRLRLLLDGMLWTLLPVTALIVLSAWLLNQWHFSSNALWILRFVTFFSLLALAYRFCLQPLRRRVGDTRVALYLEEHEPGLKSIMLSAVDARQPDNQELSAQLIEQLQRRALDACAGIGFGDRVESARILQASWKLGFALLLIIALAAWPPAFLQSGVPALLKPWASANEVSPYRIELAPGNVEIARAADQLISARIEGFDGDGVLLFTSTDEGASWRQTAMTSAREAGLYEALLFDVEADTDYYVSGAGRQTPQYRLSVVNIPAIESIGLRYHFPAYTMLPPETSHGNGDIAALRGTRVEVLIEPSIDIPGGALRLADGSEVGLRRGDGASWIGEITVRGDSAYRVALQRAGGIAVEASPEYRISALDDLFPDVSIVSPGRDIKVSMIEEPLLKVRASDDQGIADLELVLSINGEDEQRIGLIADDIEAEARRQVEAEHIVYLEDLGLRPGDLVSYYVSATDRAPGDDTRTATSDIFFYQVRPFSQNFRRAEQQGGGGGGGAQGGQRQGHLSEQQKQFVVATFKMIRDRSQYSDEAYRENLELLTTAQARIRDRVQAIIRRIQSRSIMQADKRYQVILDELPLAVKAMREVEGQLRQSDVEAALTDAQVALKHLQRADAEFRDINVSLANRGGGGGNNTGFEDLANLFQLEMDKLRHQYDTVQRAAQQPQPNEVIDETLDKLRELARRQQQQLEQMMRRQDQAQGDAARRRQLALAEELEELARQLERLSRKQPNPQLRQSVEQMRNAAEAMRRAASNPSGGGAAGIDQARKAAEDLRAARQLLDRGRVRQFSERLERSLRRAEMVERKQASIKQSIAELEPEWGDKLKSQLQRLEQKKQALSADLADLEGDLSKLTATAKDEQPEAGQSLKQAIRSAREHRLHDRIGRTRHMLLVDRRIDAIENETAIQVGIAEVRKHIEKALQNVGEGGNRELERSLEQLRDLARELRYIRDRGSVERRAGSGRRIDAESKDRPGFDGGPIEPGELERLAERSRELGRGLREQGVPAGDIDPVLAQMEGLARGRDDDEIPASPLQQDLALRALMELEFKLRGRAGESDYPGLLISEPAELPDDYREMVADYFRELSEQ